MSLSSKEPEMISNFKKALKLKNKASRYARGGETEKRYYSLNFGDVYFYKFLCKIGLSPAKSKILKSVVIPKIYFSDFLRGLFDGDGSFYTFWDKRWPNSFCFKLSIASASMNFTTWLKETLTRYYGVKGFVHKGAGVYNLEYVKGDTKKLFHVMYSSNKILFLGRKYVKIRDALRQDKDLGFSYLRKHRKPE